MKILSLFLILLSLSSISYPKKIEKSEIKKESQVVYTKLTIRVLTEIQKLSID